MLLCRFSSLSWSPHLHPYKASFKELKTYTRFKEELFEIIVYAFSGQMHPLLLLSDTLLRLSFSIIPLKHQKSPASNLIPRDLIYILLLLLLLHVSLL